MKKNGEHIKLININNVNINKLIFVVTSFESQCEQNEYAQEARKNR